MFRETRHGRHIAADRVDEARADASAHFAHRQHESGWRALERRVMAQAQVRLRHADGEPAEAVRLVVLDLPLGLPLVCYPRRAVDGFCNRLNLRLDRLIEIIKEVK